MTNMAQQPSPFRKRDTLYFLDGNIALCADPKDGTRVGYRAPKGILIRVAPEFEDMLFMPQGPLQSQETFDGVPLAIMADKHEVLECLVGFLYPNLERYGNRC